MRIRDMREEDVPALAEMLSRAYRDALSDGLAVRLRAAIRAGVKSFVADDERDGAPVGAPVGMVHVYDYGTTSFVALMGVEPGRQRSGVGKAIMGAICAWLDGARGGLPSELYATPEGHGLYLRHGFADDGAAGVWFGRGASGGGDTSGVCAASAADHDAIHALDREAFGADRGRSFRAHLENPANAVFVADGGFAVAQRAAKVLGPVVARDAAGAARLLRAAAAAFDGEHRVNALARDDADRMLRDAGYRLDRTVQRMVRGAVPVGRRDDLFVTLNLGQG